MHVSNEGKYRICSSKSTAFLRKIEQVYEYMIESASLVVQKVKCLPTMRETWVRSLGGEDFPGEGNGNQLQYSCLENPMDGEAWWATVHGVEESQTRLSNFTFTFRKT